MMLYSPRWRLVTKLAIFAISASKHGRQLLTEVFIYSKDITPSPGYLKGWRIFKMTAATLGPKSFQELVFKTFKNRKRSSCVDRRQVRSTDQNLFFFKPKLLILGDDDNCE